MKSKFMTARLGAKLLLIQAIGPFANWDSVITSQTWFGFRDFRKVTPKSKLYAKVFYIICTIS